MQHSIFKTILSHAPKYLTGSVISAGTTMFMTKYYTTVFEPAQYGILALYLVMFQYVITFTSLNLDSGSTRFYFDYRDTKRDEYLSTIFWFISFIAVFVFSIGMIFKDYISNWIAPDTGSIYIVTIVAGIAGVYVSFLTRILYNEHKSTSVLKQTIFQTFVNHFSSFIFIYFFHLGIFGRMSGQGLGYLLNVFTLLKRFSTENLFRLKLVFNQAMAKETFLLALPGIIASLQNVVFVYLDRVFIKYYMGDGAVGVYTLGFMLGQGLSMVYEAISQAILPKVYSNMNKDYKKAKDELEYFSYRYYIGLVIITIIISLCSPIIVDIFSNESYKEASNVMPFVMAGFMMGGFYKIPSLILGYHKKVWFYPFLSAFSFGTNALLNWYLIPIYGIVGAGFASFMGLFLYSSVMQILSFKYMSKKYKFSMMIGYIFLFIIIFLVFILN